MCIGALATSHAMQPLHNQAVNVPSHDMPKCAACQFGKQTIVQCPENKQESLKNVLEYCQERNYNQEKEYLSIVSNVQQEEESSQVKVLEIKKSRLKYPIYPSHLKADSSSLIL